MRIESFEADMHSVKFILYNAGREVAFIKEIRIGELTSDKKPSNIVLRTEKDFGDNPPFPWISPSSDITLEPKTSIKVEGATPFPGAAITKDYRITIYDGNYKIMAKKDFQVSW